MPAGGAFSSSVFGATRVRAAYRGGSIAPVRASRSTAAGCIASDVIDIITPAQNQPANAVVRASARAGCDSGAPACSGGSGIGISWS